MTPSSKRHPLLRLISYSRRHRRRVIVASLFSVLNKVFDLAPPGADRRGGRHRRPAEDSFIAPLGVGDPADQLVLLAVLTLIIWILESVFEYVHRVQWRNLAQTLEHELRIDAYSHVQDLELAYFEDRSTGGLMSILNDDINQLERFLDVGANDLIQVVTTRDRHRRDLHRGGAQRGVDGAAADAVHHLGLDLVPAQAGPALCGGARAGRHPQRPARQQPERHRHDQELHGRAPRGRADARTKATFTASATRRAIALSSAFVAADPHGDRGRASSRSWSLAGGWCWMARSTSARTACWCS